jgi:hypothetical protein
MQTTQHLHNIPPSPQTNPPTNQTTTTLQQAQHQHPPKMSTPKAAATFTARETELLTIAFQCLKSKPDVSI